jgi:hypothetical protein
MELDDLKGKWKQETSANTGLGAQEMEKVQLVLSGKAEDMLASLKKKYQKIIGTMLFGMLALLLAFPILSDGFAYPGSISGFAKAMFFYLLAIIFYWAKLNSISNMELSEHIKERLQQLLAILTKNRKIELFFVALFAVSFIIAGRFFYGHGLVGIFKPEVIGGSVIIVVFTAVLLIYIQRRYTGQIEELKGYLREYEGLS